MFCIVLPFISPFIVFFEPRNLFRNARASVFFSALWMIHHPNGSKWPFFNVIHGDFDDQLPNGDVSWEFCIELGIFHGLILQGVDSGFGTVQAHA